MVKAVITPCLLCLAAAGCVKYTQPPPQAVALTEPRRNFEAVWRASETVLRRHNFQLDRQDRRAGVITTFPLVGRYFLEFWRSDAVAPRDVLEGTVQSVFRTVTVTIRPEPDDPQRYTATTQVQVWRSDKQPPQVTSASQVPNIAGVTRRPSELDRSRYQGNIPSEQDMILIGRDEKLEARLDEQIAREAQRLLSGEQPSWFAETFEKVFGQKISFPAPN